MTTLARLAAADHRMTNEGEVMTETVTCTAALNIRGEHFPCDWPTDENGQHSGWAHSNRVAETIWSDDAARVTGR